MLLPFKKIAWSENACETSLSFSLSHSLKLSHTLTSAQSLSFPFKQKYTLSTHICESKGKNIAGDTNLLGSSEQIEYGWEWIQKCEWGWCCRGVGAPFKSAGPYSVIVDLNMEQIFSLEPSQSKGRSHSLRKTVSVENLS